MRTIRFGYKRQREDILHIETPLGIINIHAKLHDRDGRPVIAVRVLPDDEVSFDGGRLIGPESLPFKIGKAV